MRIIDADALSANLDGMMAVSPTGYIHGDTVADMIGDAPTIEPERKMGKWIEREKKEEKYCIECSECGEQFTTKDTFDFWKSEYLFCHRCGADMRGNQE